MDYLLHTENFRQLPFRGAYLESLLAKRVTQLLKEVDGKQDPDISIVIRTKNDMEYIKALFADIKAQLFTGKVETIVVDTSSTDGTAEFARSQDATVISIKQADFTYPKALNMGFRAANHPYVMTIVGHSALTSRLYLKTLTRYYDVNNFGGVFGWPLPNWNGSMTERLSTSIGMAKYLRSVDIISQPTMGVLGANSAILSRAAWEKFGGYDEHFAMGGEDGALGTLMLQDGMFVVRDPLCTVFHSHGLSLVNGIRQFWHWHQVAKPLPFEEDKLLARRPDMRKKRT